MRQGCGAQKLVEFNRFWQNVLVYHLGEHTCWPKVSGPQRNCNRRLGDAKKNALQRCMDKIEAGDIDGAEQEAKDWELNSNISTGMSDVEQIQQS